MLVLQYIAIGALQNTRRAAAVAGRMLSERVPTPAGFDPHQLHCRVIQKRMEDADGVGAAAHARKYRIGQASIRVEYLPARLLADHLMEVADHHGVRMRTERGTEQIV